MAHYAKVVSNEVVEVIQAQPEFFDTFIDNTPGEWIETFEDGITRKNYAYIGGIYDLARDAFYAIQPFNSWTLNEDTCQWEAPEVMPAGTTQHKWNEEALAWDEFIEPTE
jgi:hypothetical protein